MDGSAQEVIFHLPALAIRSFSDIPPVKLPSINLKISPRILLEIRDTRRTTYLNIKVNVNFQLGKIPRN